MFQTGEKTMKFNKIVLGFVMVIVTMMTVSSARADGKVCYDKERTLCLQNSVSEETCADRAGEQCISNAYNAYALGHKNFERWNSDRVKCENEFLDRWYTLMKRYPLGRHITRLETPRASAANKIGCLSTVHLMSFGDLDKALKSQQDFLAQRERDRRNQIRREHENAPPTFDEQVAQYRAQRDKEIAERRANLYTVKPVRPEDVKRVTPTAPAPSQEESSEASAELAQLDSADLDNAAQVEAQPGVQVQINSALPAEETAQNEPRLSEKTTHDGLPKELELRSANSEEARLFVRKGAYYAQIERSWLAKNYNTDAPVVYQANQFKDTFGVCVHEDGTREIDPSRMSVKSWEKDKLDGPANVDFMNQCKGRFTLALQGYQLLVLPAKKSSAKNVIPEVASGKLGNKPVSTEANPEVEKPQPSRAAIVPATDKSEAAIHPASGSDSDQAPNKGASVSDKDVGEEVVAMRPQFLPPMQRTARFVYLENPNLIPERCKSNPSLCGMKAPSNKPGGSSSGGKDVKSTVPPH